MYYPGFMIMFALVVLTVSFPVWFQPIGKWLIEKLEQAEARKAKAQD